MSSISLTVEARQQISFSDILIITKSELVSAEDLQHIKSILTGINPFAEVFSGVKGVYPFDEILTVERKNIVEKRPKFSLLPSVSEFKHEDIVSLSFTFTDPFSITVLQHQLLAFLLFQARDVYRVKGIVYAAGNDKKIIIQSVNASLVVDYGDEWQPDEAKSSRIVFIGRNLQPAGFERMLKQCIVAT